LDAPEAYVTREAVDTALYRGDAEDPKVAVFRTLIASQEEAVASAPKLGSSISAEDLKAWVRREMKLAASGVDEEERKKLNP